MRPPASRPDVALRPALEHLVKGIVDHPDDVRVRMVDSRRGQRLEVRVHPEDLGRVIGRSGRTAKALRTIVAALADGRRVRVDLGSEFDALERGKWQVLSRLAEDATLER